MALLRLRPWPFAKDEVVNLYWMCSPYQNTRGRWRIKVAFLTETSEIRIVEFPWGVLPYLRLGQKYCEGHPLIFKTGRIGIIDILDSSAGELCNAFTLPTNLYYLYKNASFGRENLWRFKLSGKEYFVPCLEIIRSFYARNKTLANALLRPRGLDLLIDRTHNMGRKLSVELNSSFPRTLLKDNTVLHLSWLFETVEARQAWESIYSGLFRKAINYNAFAPSKVLQWGLPLEASPPMIGQLRWVFRGIEKGQNVLVMEIMNITGLKFPFSEVEYTHPSLREKKKANSSRKVVASHEKSSLQNYVLDESGKLPKHETDEEGIEPAGVGVGFIDLPQISKKSMTSNQVNTGSGRFITSGSGGAREIRQTTVSLDDSVPGGEVIPGEFIDEDGVIELVDNGFIEFAKAVEYILTAMPDVEISVSTFEVPLGKKVSLCSNGRRRQCATIYINTPKSSQTCILEVLRSDDWEISTLIVKPNELISLSTLGNYARNLISMLVASGGHWYNKALKSQQEFRVEKLKHVKGQSGEQWGKRILQKI